MIDHLVMTYGDSREYFLTLTHVMATKSQAITTQAQDITTQVNQEIEPRVNRNASSMAS